MMEYLALPIENAPNAKMRQIFQVVLVVLKGKTMPFPCIGHSLKIMNANLINLLE